MDQFRHDSWDSTDIILYILCILVYVMEVYRLYMDLGWTTWPQVCPAQHEWEELIVTTRAQPAKASGTATVDCSQIFAALKLGDCTTNFCSKWVSEQGLFVFFLLNATLQAPPARCFLLEVYCFRSVQRAVVRKARETRPDQGRKAERVGPA